MEAVDSKATHAHVRQFYHGYMAVCIVDAASLTLSRQQGTKGILCYHVRITTAKVLFVAGDNKAQSFRAASRQRQFTIASCQVPQLTLE